MTLPAIISKTPTFLFLVPVSAVKDQLSRLTLYARWIDDRGSAWYAPDLAAYRDHLIGERGLSAASAASHLSTIRSQYKALLRDNGLRDTLYASAPIGVSAADKKAHVDEVLTRLQNAVDPATAPVKVAVRQDRADGAHVRLTVAQAKALLAAPQTDTLTGLRDRALIGLMLCTGIREAEACALKVKDLEQEYGGVPALHVREGKGMKERLVPYGMLIGCLTAVKAWLEAAGISGADETVFRGIRKGDKVIATPLTVRTAQNILHKYPIRIGKAFAKVDPHDLRRSYAKLLYAAGVELVAIQQNLGHSNIKTTLSYVGALDAEQRQPPDLFGLGLGL